ncbi:MAG: hypothetical protein ISS71_07365, partial [Phycisphaerae bacterium]|nr:hypothetical protein [Phycisphaerae bacterium]
MIKKQLIGSVLMLCFAVEIIYFETFRNSYQHHVYRLFGITEEVFCFFIALFLYLLAFIAGSFIWRNKLIVYSSISWAITSVILAGFALWAFVLMRNPTESEWGGLAQSMVYYLIGTSQSQTAVSLAMLALCTSWKTKNKFFPELIWLSLTFGTFMLILHIWEFMPIIIDFQWPISLYWILINIVPVGFIVTLILLTSKEKKVKSKICETNNDPISANP